VTSRLPIAALLSLSLLLAFLALGSGASAAAGVTGVVSPSCGSIQFGGAGAAEALIVSDLPLQGDSRRRSVQMNDAIRLVLEESGWKAGGRSVGLQACDDSSAKTGLWTPSICRANARAYAADPSVLAVIGTYNSGCAEAEIPILGAAAGGGLAMVSPGNTAICLTQTSPSCGGGTPGSLYPHGRNYARVVPNDAYQGAGLASFAEQTGIRRAFVLYAAKDPTSLGQARTFRGAARKLGIGLAGFRSWNPSASSYRTLMRQVAATSPDAVLLAGLTEENGARLIEDKVAAMGPNSGAVKLLAPDGFAQQSTIQLAGAASKGMFASVPGLVPQELTGPGRKLVKQLQGEVGGPVELYAPYAGQAASVVLGAIAKGTQAAPPGAGATAPARSRVTAAVFATRVTNGVTGSFRILPSGDPSVGPITVSVARRSFVPVREVEPGQALVKAARKG
jgi:branched-chain amino acid transport system substrate-binding protein